MPFVFEGYAPSETEPEQDEKFQFEGYEKPSFRERHGFKGMGLKKPLSVAAAGAKGLIEGIQGINPFQQGNPISPKQGMELAERFLPSEEGTEEDIARIAGGLAPIVATGEEGLLQKAAQLGAGTLGGLIAKENNFGPVGTAITEGAAMSAPGLIKATVNAAKAIPKATKQTMASGLTQPRAVESKLSKVATIGKGSKNTAIENLNKEASKLSRESLEKNMPWVKRVEQGFDKTKLDEGFNQLEKAVKRNNVNLDITPVTNLMEESIKKYRGLASPHAEAIKIRKEAQAFYKKPPTTLDKAYKTYRSNNRKLAEIHEKSLVSGKQSEYAKFLRDQNKAIGKSFRNTLGENNAWVKEFETMNSINTKIKSAEKTLKELEPLLTGRNLTAKSLSNLAFDQKKQKQLAVIMKDEKAANEIIQIAKDLSTAKEAINKIPTTTRVKWELALPLTSLFPGLRELGGIYATQKIGRHMLGYWLSKPATRRAYGDAIKAFKNQDLEAYKKAALILTRSLDNEGIESKEE